MNNDPNAFNGQSNGMQPDMNNQMNMNYGAVPQNPGMPVNNGMQPDMSNQMGMAPQPDMNSQMGMAPQPNMNTQMNMASQPDMYNSGYPNNGMPMDNGNMYYQNGMTPQAPQKNNKMIIAVILLLVMVLIIVGVVLVVNKKKETPKTYEEVIEQAEKEEKETKEDIMKKVSYKSEFTFTSSSSIYNVFSVTSNASKFVNIDIPIKYYDSNNVQVKEDYLLFTCVEPGTTLFDASSVDSSKGAKFKIDESKISATYSADYNKCVSYKDKISHTVSQVPGDDDYEITITSKVNQSIGISGMAIIYKDGKPIDIDNVYIDSVDAGGTVKDTIYVPYDSNTHAYVKPDKIELLITEVRLS